ncbi:MAG: hypothetical protein M3R13_11250 [Armatimonadota bacterium]|nr:hypothetical protein [Armatimonadota bacterium]
MKTFTMSLAFALGALSLAQQMDQEGLITKAALRRLDSATVSSVLEGWKSKPKAVAKKMIAKYGQPNEATTTRLVWFNSGPWKFSILTNEAIPHKFPMMHHDMLRQGIDYKVPSHKFNDVLNYDGSIVIDRTPGEISARCDKEEMNFLAVNLANDVATGKRSVNQARDFYAKTAMAFMKMKMNAQQRSYTSGFTFKVSKNGTAFPDKPAMKMGG